MKKEKQSPKLIITKAVLISISVFALFLFSCDGAIPQTVNDMEYDVMLVKNSLFAKQEGKNIILEFDVENHTDSEKEVKINFKLEHLTSQENYGTKSLKLTTKKGVQKHKVTIPSKIPENNTKGKSDYVWYNVSYNFSADDIIYTDLKSLYHCMVKYNIQVIANDEWEAGSSVPIRVLAKDKTKEENNSNIEVSLLNSNNKVISKKTYKTDKTGELLAEIKSPEDEGTYTLNIKTQAKGTDISDSALFNINVNKKRKIYITTDKPMYQPGQDINIRALALTTGKKPLANRPAIITVLDGKGNKVFKEDGKTNDFGVYSAVFSLASFVNLGHYKIEVDVDGTVTEKTVSVERYVLPKFKVSLETEKEFYSPGEDITGTVSSRYFFGKPVNNSQVTINLFTFDVEWNLISTLNGFTDEEGYYDFNIEVPDYLIGSQLEQGSAFVMLEISVTDNANHTQGTTKNIAISESPIVPIIFPETERFAKNMEIKFYVVTSDPLGRPIESTNTIKIGNDTVNVNTNKQGFGSFMYQVKNLPLRMKIQSKSSSYNSKKEFYFTGGADYGSEHILLRTNQPNYKVGDKIDLQIISSFNTKKVYLDVINENKTLLTKTLELTNKNSEYSIPVTQDMNGIVKLSAYTILSESSIVRDSRLIYVDQADDIKVEINPEKAVYLPGEDAVLNVKVTDNKGKGQQSAVGFVIVDEAVYALQENKPGLERVYFEVEEAFKEPKYEIHAFSYQDIFIGNDIVEEGKAEIFLTANNQNTSYGIEYSSINKDVDNIKNNLNYHIEENCFYPMLQKMRNIIYKNNDRLRDTKTPLKEQYMDIINNERIIIYDLWKKKLKLEYNNGTVSIISAGIDQIFGNIDDFTLSFDENSLLETYYDYQWRVGDFKIEKNGIWVNDMEGGDWARNNSIEEAIVKSTGAMGGNNESSGDDGIRVRKYFPETLHVEPSLITDRSGEGEVKLTVADSITDWRISSTANTKDGKLGSSVSSLRVFQEFFIDIDFPVSLTQNDEVSVPVAIYNYLDTDQTISLTVKGADWFELLDNPVRERRLSPNEVTVEYFTIKAKEIGKHAFRVTAKGSTLSDAIERRIEIKPDGDAVELSYSNRLANITTEVVNIPPDAIEKSQQLIVKIYPGLFSQVVEGLDSLFRMPSGCFEQTSSTTYPNVLALKYMQESGIVSPEIEMKASSYINQGYQRLLTFEVNGGGFEWFGNPPANNILTAYGLMEFYDMSFVHNVDPAIITRTQGYLLSRQDYDGSFPPDDGGIAEGAINAFRDNKLRNTGYIAWALAYSGYKEGGVSKAIGYIKENVNYESDSFTLAILANALLTYDKSDQTGQSILKELDSRKISVDDGVYWSQEESTSMYGTDNVAVIETTAIVAHAMLVGQSYFASAEQAINYLITKKDTFGNWSSTQATIATLRTFIRSLGSGTKEAEGTISIEVNDKELKKLNITKKNFDVMQMVDISPFIKKGDNEVVLKISSQDDPSYLYQIAGSYYIPKLGNDIGSKEAISINIDYDKTSLKVDDMITVDAVVSNNTPNVDFGMMIVDIGIAPGFDVVVDDLMNYVNKGVFSKVEPAGRQLIIYIDELKAKQSIDFTYRMKARYPMKVKSPKAEFYSYYGDDSVTYNPPEIEVKD